MAQTFLFRLIFFMICVALITTNAAAQANSSCTQTTQPQSTADDDRALSICVTDRILQIWLNFGLHLAGVVLIGLATTVHDHYPTTYRREVVWDVCFYLCIIVSAVLAIYINLCFDSADMLLVGTAVVGLLFKKNLPRNWTIHFRTLHLDTPMWRTRKGHVYKRVRREPPSGDLIRRAEALDWNGTAFHAKLADGSDAVIVEERDILHWERTHIKWKMLMRASRLGNRVSQRAAAALRMACALPFPAYIAVGKAEYYAARATLGTEVAQAWGIAQREMEQMTFFSCKKKTFVECNRQEDLAMLLHLKSIDIAESGNLKSPEFENVWTKNILNWIYGEIFLSKLPMIPSSASAAPNRVLLNLSIPSACTVTSQPIPEPITLLLEALPALQDSSTAPATARTRNCTPVQRGLFSFSVALPTVVLKLSISIPCLSVPESTRELVNIMLHLKITASRNGGTIQGAMPVSRILLSDSIRLPSGSITQQTPSAERSEYVNAEETKSISLNLECNGAVRFQTTIPVPESNVEAIEEKFVEGVLQKALAHGPVDRSDQTMYWYFLGRDDIDWAVIERAPQWSIENEMIIKTIRRALREDEKTDMVDHGRYKARLMDKTEYLVQSESEDRFWERSNGRWKDLKARLEASEEKLTNLKKNSDIRGDMKAIEHDIALFKANMLAMRMAHSIPYAAYIPSSNHDTILKQGSTWWGNRLGEKFGFVGRRERGWKFVRCQTWERVRLELMQYIKTIESEQDRMQFAKDWLLGEILTDRNGDDRRLKEQAMAWGSIRDVDSSSPHWYLLSRRKAKDIVDARTIAHNGEERSARGDSNV